MKTYTISPESNVTFARVGATYLAIFGALWLFVEPLEAFGLLPSMNTASALVVYASLLIVPALAMPPLLRCYRWYKTHRLPFVKLSVRSASDGAIYSLKVAENMQVWQVMDRFVEILSRGPGRDAVETTLRRHYPVLQAKRDGIFVDVDGSSTVHGAGLRDGDECQVRAQRSEYRDMPMFSRKR